MRTTSFWAHVEVNRDPYLNSWYGCVPVLRTKSVIANGGGVRCSYNAPIAGVLPQYELCANYKRLVLWREYYFRYYPSMLPFSV